MTSVPDTRIRPLNQKPLNPEGHYVLYWMTAFRRLAWNFALQHAANLSRERGKPLLILEILGLDLPYPNRRLHAFALQGMAERARSLQGTGVSHYPFVESSPGEEEGLLESLGKEAVCVVTDDFPGPYQRRGLERARRGLAVRLEGVDSNGLLPLSAPEKAYGAAYHFRRYLQKELPNHLFDAPRPDPLQPPLPQEEIRLPPGLVQRWPKALEPLLVGREEAVAALPLVHEVESVPMDGTRTAALSRLGGFLEGSLSRYAQDRNHPDLDAASGLSPYLHMGLISSHEVFQGVAAAEGWTPLRISPTSNGKREGWWGMGEGAEAFLDQLVTWRELGFNWSWLRPGESGFGSLPEWAQDTLKAHQGDERPHLYDIHDFREARTHDAAWNAAQNQLLREGVIHNYLRMLWGKKILEWSASPEEALETMLELNDSLALDGQDPNSYSGILWCLGRYDRGWPERPIYGKIRSMSSKATRRKVSMEQYLDRFASSRT